MMYCWSHPVAISGWRWKISCLPSREKYASALLPPKVSWRTLRKWVSPGWIRAEPVAAAVSTATADWWAGTGLPEEQASRVRAPQHATTTRSGGNTTAPGCDNATDREGTVSVGVGARN